MPITGLPQAAKRTVAIPVDWRVRPRCSTYNHDFYFDVALDETGLGLDVAATVGA